MVSIHLLQTPNLPKVPEDVEVVDDYGVVTIMVDGAPSNGMISGNHIVVQAEELALRKWLGESNGFWLGVGAPFMQKFEIAHVREP